MAALTPKPFAHLLARALAEYEHDRSIFHLPKRSFWKPREGLDLSVVLPGGRASTPLGPAAGPHTQLAQNLVAAWLAGSRILELKTVQVLDRLEIPRPCIDAPGEGYNVEWSQELTLEESAREYATAWYLIHILRARGIPSETGAHTIFDGSVGYDLAGIRSASVAKFLDTMMDTRALLATLRESLPSSLRAIADVPVPARVFDTVTLSSFHGCPPDEIERIVEHLLTRHALHVVVKLNPTLLGYETVESLLRGSLGYEHVELDRTAFEKDLQWNDALRMLDWLAGLAARNGLSLGVKFSNTLVVKNTRGKLEGEHVYLSGPPLHVIATTLADRFVKATGARYPISFSAGITAENFPDAVAHGFSPVTTCTDLLKPTGYRRLPRYLKALESDMERVGAATLAEYVRARAGVMPSVPVSEASAANLSTYASKVASDPAYHAPAPSEPPTREPLPLFDCESCNNCLLVCPNGAFHAIEAPPTAMAAGDFQRELQWVVDGGTCNECGNCDTHCPQEGGPWRVKPRWNPEKLAFDAPGATPSQFAAIMAAWGSAKR